MQTNTKVLTLEYAFRELFDMTPREILRLLRLHAARRVLPAANPEAEETISEIAYTHRFYEVGCFAGLCKQAFGEPPSMTLQKN